MVNMDVSFRYIGIKTEKGEVPAICLCYPDEQSASNVVKIFHEYISSPSGEKFLNVDILKDSSGNYSLSIILSMRNNVLETNILGIEPTHVKKIKQLLNLVTYYVLLIGYNKNGNFHVFPINEFHIFKRDIIIDGENIAGFAPCDIDWSSITGN